MELRALRTFQYVAQLHSFSKAAEALGYTQAAISIQIQQLEKELQSQLFDRFHKSVSLTQSGEIFYEYALRILQDSEQAKVALQATKSIQGHLRIGMIESLCASVFPLLLHSFHAQYPDVRISIETASPEVLLDEMNHNKLDIVYFIDKIRRHEQWVSCLEIPEDIVFVCNNKHPLCESKNLLLADILEQPLILTEPAASYRFLLEQQVLHIGKKLQPYLEIGNTDFIIHELLSDQVISFLPHYCVQSYLQDSRLSVLEPIDFNLQIYRQIMYHKNKWKTPSMEAFLDYIKSYHEG